MRCGEIAAFALNEDTRCECTSPGAARQPDAVVHRTRCAGRRRELHWDALDVEAHLNADGVLEVIERHTMVFTGDWNGGERVFNVRPRQSWSSSAWSG